MKLLLGKTNIANIFSNTSHHARTLQKSPKKPQPKQTLKIQQQDILQFNIDKILGTYSKV